MKVNFVIVNPSGNTTALILNALPREVYPKIASKMMKSGNFAIEQVGFIERPIFPNALARLHMMGEEFCGNASRGLASWLVERQFLGINAKQGSRGLIVPIEVSGHRGVLTAIVNPYPSKKKTYHVEISMPLPLWIRQKPLKETGSSFTLIGFEGIVHAVVLDSSPSENQFQIFKKEIYEELGETKALGVMFYNESTNFLTPVVYVREVGSLVWESSCGSGAVAVASLLAEKYRDNIESLKLSQPGGIIEVSVRWEGKVVEARISGDVTIEAEGAIDLDI
jgi:diaminopimelate epimerase